MTITTIPTSLLPSYIERVQLDGAPVQLRFRFNTRANSWVVDVYDEAGAPVVLGRRILIDRRIIGQFHHRTGVPPGEIMAWDTTERKDEPGLKDLGTRVLLLYMDAAEVATLVFA